MNKVYCIRGINSLGRERYIQDHGANPQITTRTGYRAYDQLVFKSETEAWYFLKNFMNSDKRANLYPITWSVVEYKPYKGMEFIGERKIWSNNFKNCAVRRIKYTRAPMVHNTIYGPAYKLATFEEYC